MLGSMNQCHFQSNRVAYRCHCRAVSRIRRLAFTSCTKKGRERLSPRAEASVSASKARSQVEQGLDLFKSKKYEDALRSFQLALNSKPKPEEAQAALYNAACCQVKLKQWAEATESVSLAVNEYQLPMKTAMQDKDLAPLRERREWRDAAENMKGSISRKTLVGIRSEQKAPFRLFRLILSSGLGASALVGLIIIITRLISSLKGGEGAPDLTESLRNLAINGAAVGILGYIFQRDLKGQQSDKKVIEREEALACLQVRIGKDRLVTLGALRGSTRPVIVTGSKGQVTRTLKGAEPYEDALQERGISIVPVKVSEEDPAAKLAAVKEQLRKQGSKGFGQKDSSPALVSTKPSEVKSLSRRFELEPHDTDEWLSWLEGVKATAGTKAENLYVQIQLDGSVRGSGEGQPPWEQFCNEIPKLDSIRTRFTDGLRR